MNDKSIPPQVISQEAQEIYRTEVAVPQPDVRDDIVELRRHFQSFNDKRLAEMRRRFDVTIEPGDHGGVKSYVVSPGEGVRAQHKDQVLVNLHGGAFMWGSGSGTLVEAVPIAATAGIRVVALDYRLAPEHKFPAATEDAIAVYSELVEHYRPGAIGLYGCSAGGVLAAQTVSTLADLGVPLPGAIATLFATGLDTGGESATLEDVPGIRSFPLAMSELPYFDEVDPASPGVFPGLSNEQLKRFPPTLLLTGSRDFASSSLTLMHRRLVANKVNAQLVVFEGMWHAFHIFPDLPESQEVYRILTQFFKAELST